MAKEASILILEFYKLRRALKYQNFNLINDLIATDFICVYKVHYA